MGRLFWKIFFWFWIALVLLNLAVGWGVRLYYGQIQQSDDRALQSRVDTIAGAFEQGEVRRARQLLENTRQKSKTPIFVVTERGRDFLDRPLPGFILEALRRDNSDHRRIYKREVALPEGSRIQLVAVYRPSWLRSFRQTPVWIALSIVLVISTLVCYWLARYLSSPVQRLSTATRQLAEGDLDVRVGRIKRRDEIADLAVDFDLMADKLQKLLNAQKQLLQDISHELRSPLARLQVALELVRRKNVDQAADYDRIARDLNRLEELIGEVLTLSRLDSVNYPREPVALSELITTIVEDCRVEAAARNCSIRLDSDPDLELDGSPELLRRAVENVLRNAVRFTAPDTEILVSAKKSGDQLLVRVSDRGPGIPDADKNAMFDAFVRIDPARSHKPGGYGLGLAIAKKAIQIHDGEIRAENRADGGLMVSIRLPCRAGMSGGPI